jgi:hypothetical protein
MPVTTKLLDSITLLAQAHVEKQEGYPMLMIDDSGKENFK